MANINRQELVGFLGRLLRGFGDFRQSTGKNGRRAVSPEVRASAHEDGLALLHIPTGRVFLCNRTASRIWQGVVKGLSAQTISEEISQECGVELDVVQQHTSSFLAELERRGLVTRRAGIA